MRFRRVRPSPVGYKWAKIAGEMKILLSSAARITVSRSSPAQIFSTYPHAPASKPFCTKLRSECIESRTMHEVGRFNIKRRVASMPSIPGIRMSVIPEMPFNSLSNYLREEPGGNLESGERSKEGA